MRLFVPMLLFVALSAAAPASVPTEREIGPLVFDGIPEIPATLRNSLRARILPYQSARSALFQDWLGDGSMLITTRFGQSFQVHRVAAPGAERHQLTFGDDGVNTAAAVPGRAAFVYQEDAAGNELYQLYMRPVAGGETRRITEENTRNESAIVSRDGALIAWARLTPGHPDYDILAADPRGTAAPTVALHGKGAVEPLDISTDDRHVLIGEEVSDTVSRRYVLDLSDGSLKPLGPANVPTSYDGGEFTHDGKAVLVLSDRGGEFKRLIRIDLASGAETMLDGDDHWGVETFDLSRDGKVIAYATNEDGISRIALRDFKSGKRLPAPPLPNGVVVALSFSPDSKKLAINLSAPNVARDVWTWTLATHRLERWTDSELGGLDPASFADPKLIHFKSFDGLSIPALVYAPKAIPGRHPVIVYLHGGPDSQERPDFYSTYQYWVKELGATVIAPNIRGSSGYGRTYVDADNGYKRENVYKDLSALLDWIGTQPDMDSRRVVFFGGSAAGLLVLGGLARFPDRVAGGVDIDGISDITSFLETTEGYRRDLRRPEYGDERDPAMRAFQQRISPLGMADRITSPLLVIQGANDPRAPKAQADQIVAKVRASGHEAWYLWAKDEGHGFHKADNLEAEREVETLFFRHVFGE
jgi:dipeptidyl aminopeptidase/acylaminoacyl peptidase